MGQSSSFGMVLLDNWRTDYDKLPEACAAENPKFAEFASSGEPEANYNDIRLLRDACGLQCDKIATEDACKGQCKWAGSCSDSQHSTEDACRTSGGEWTFKCVQGLPRACETLCDETLTKRFVADKIEACSGNDILTTVEDREAFAVEVLHGEALTSDKRNVWGMPWREKYCNSPKRECENVCKMIGNVTWKSVYASMGGDLALLRSCESGNQKFQEFRDSNYTIEHVDKLFEACFTSPTDSCTQICNGLSTDDGGTLNNLLLHHMKTCSKEEDLTLPSASERSAFIQGWTDKHCGKAACKSTCDSFQKLQALVPND